VCARRVADLVVLAASASGDQLWLQSLTAPESPALSVSVASFFEHSGDAVVISLIPLSVSSFAVRMTGVTHACGTSDSSDADVAAVVLRLKSGARVPTLGLVRAFPCAASLTLSPAPLLLAATAETAGAAGAGAGAEAALVGATLAGGVGFGLLDLGSGTLIGGAYVRTYAREYICALHFVLSCALKRASTPRADTILAAPFYYFTACLPNAACAGTVGWDGWLLGGCVGARTAGGLAVPSPGSETRLVGGVELMVIKSADPNSPLAFDLATRGPLVSVFAYTLKRCGAARFG
jgi:hypothetical protein